MLAGAGGSDARRRDQRERAGGSLRRAGWDWDDDADPEGVAPSGGAQGFQWVVDLFAPKGLAARFTETPDTVDINYVNVDPAVRSNGTGSRFMQTAQEYCRESGKQLIVSEVDNEPFFGKFPFLNREAPASGARPRYLSSQKLASRPDHTATTRSLYHGTLRDHMNLIKRLGLVPQVGDFTSDAYGLDEDGNYDQGDEDPYSSEELGVEPSVFMTDRPRLDKALTAIRHNVSQKLGIDFHDVTPQHVQSHGLLVKQPGEMGWSDDPRSDKHLQYPYVPDDGREAEPWEDDPKWLEQNRTMEPGSGHPYQAEPGDFYSDSTVSPNNLQFIHGPAMMRVFCQQGLLDPQNWNPGGIGGQPVPPPYGTGKPSQTFSATSTCPTCGDPLKGEFGTFCPRCQWSERDVKLDDDNLSNPADPTKELHRGIQSRWFPAVQDSL